MSDLVDADKIEVIVGAPRQKVMHLGRAVSETETVYILHAAMCILRDIDLRDCRFSIALDRGIDVAAWAGAEDRPVLLGMNGDGQLVPHELPASVLAAIES